MPIRGKSKTAQDPNSALKSKSKKAKAETPSATEPTKTPKPTTAPTGILPTIALPLPNIPFRTTPPMTLSGGSSTAIHRKDLTQVNHGLDIPEFQPNQWMAKDLFTNSSPLPETSQAEADQAVLSIARKRQTLRIVRENIGLNRDIVGAATEHQQLLGAVIQYSTELVNNQTKFVKYTDAGVKQQIAAVKLSQSQEQFTQETIALDGLRQMTPLIQEEWNERLELRRAKINGLREQTLNANARLASKRQELEAMFNVEFQTI
ncbi:hypothetical protein NIES2135_64280 (plasmid) [Leptolyngbya boryana NIES-2135]|uniref:Uncharacterized protein n=2 Tax=Leptolyngbya boryana TaxID=1184 RepID=A0A1Z4JS11_LEPBY|nr:MULTISPECIES: hypothetical protein [Leptolyngbya]BAY59551.1 hypothetical protein NIES2135_64280 [Leptolyngbya boryana NIES-2135]MBD2371125.1 hypothetical protein [Leptolyngbya sp. FACHB-161]MBD2377593.1 hypothetical protein [Leptolyngbya sp. FACHB-238]MBD2402077.1 hypothetical protein [Leptolyngbya sp. FACHB-239]MBD2408596.1 hypothetical protein [Leptolyngbya sp. FACHB-402]